MIEIHHQTYVKSLVMNMMVYFTCIHTHTNCFAGSQKMQLFKNISNNRTRARTHEQYTHTYRHTYYCLTQPIQIGPFKTFIREYKILF